MASLKPGEIADRITVKIVSARAGANIFQGSGMILQSSPHSKFLYVVTARHCIEGRMDERDMTRNITDIMLENVWSKHGPRVSYIPSDTRDCLIKAEGIDLAILFVERKQFVEKTGWESQLVGIGTPSDQEKCFFRGYPGALNGEDAINLRSEVRGLSHLPQTGEFSCVVTDPLGFETTEKVVGFSGGGLFVIKNDRLVLVGMVIEFDDNYTRIIALGTEAINLFLHGVEGGSYERCPSLGSTRLMILRDRRESPENAYPSDYASVSPRLDTVFHWEDAQNTLPVHLGTFLGLNRRGYTAVVFSHNDELLYPALIEAEAELHAVYDKEETRWVAQRGWLILKENMAPAHDLKSLQRQFKQSLLVELWCKDGIPADQSVGIVARIYSDSANEVSNQLTAVKRWMDSIQRLLGEKNRVSFVLQFPGLSDDMRKVVVDTLSHWAVPELYVLKASFSPAVSAQASTVMQALLRRFSEREPEIPRVSAAHGGQLQAAIDWVLEAMFRSRDPIAFANAYPASFDLLLDSRDYGRQRLEQMEQNRDFGNRSGNHIFENASPNDVVNGLAFLNPNFSASSVSGTYNMIEFLDMVDCHLSEKLLKIVKALAGSKDLSLSQAPVDYAFEKKRFALLMSWMVSYEGAVENLPKIKDRGEKLMQIALQLIEGARDPHKATLRKGFVGKFLAQYGQFGSSESKKRIAAFLDADNEEASWETSTESLVTKLYGEAEEGNERANLPIFWGQQLFWQHLLGRALDSAEIGYYLALAPLWHREILGLTCLEETNGLGSLFASGCRRPFNLKEEE